MKILYSVQGTGHITRVRHMAKSFAKRRDIEVNYLFSGRSSDAYFDMQSFSPYSTKRGLTFVTENGQVSNPKTLIKNKVLKFSKDVSALNVKEYDLLTNDFEPLSAGVAKNIKIT
jgi:uncharacterized protein (TIGR00661 family)